MEELIKESTATTSAEFAEIEKVLQQESEPILVNITANEIINSSQIKYNNSRNDEFEINNAINSKW